MADSFNLPRRSQRGWDDEMIGTLNWLKGQTDGSLKKASNLGDLADKAAARAALQLGTAATTDASAYATAAQGVVATFDQAALVDNLPSKFYISHRGGSLIHPEHSMEGYRASAAAGFLPEQDIYPLADGTLVCIHDGSVDRTMSGGVGNVNTFTREQWHNLRIKPLMAGLPAVRPVEWLQVLDEFGGRTVLVPEIKSPTDQSTADVIASIVNRRLQRSVIVQSFDYNSCLTSAAAGIATLYLSDLVGTAGNPTIQAVIAAGIEFIGASTGASDAYITGLVAAGLKVIVWTVNDKVAADRFFGLGAVAVFSDDPWRVSQDYAPTTFRDQFTDLAVPPQGFLQSGGADGTGEKISYDAPAGGIVFTHYSVDGSTGRYVLGRFGVGSNALKLRFKTEIGLSAASDAPTNDNAWAWGLYIGENKAGGPHTEALANEQWFLIIRRRSGGATVYYKSYGNTPVILLTAAPIPALALTKDQTQPEHEVSVEVTAGQQITVRDLTLQAQGQDVPVVVTPPDGSKGLGWLSTSSYITACARTSTLILKDVRISR